MKNKLTLSTDRKSAAEGDYIEVSWACDACPDSLYLAYDSGSERYSMAVADSGTTRILIRKSDGKAVFTLNALIGNKKVSQSVEVKIKKAKSARPAKVSIRLSAISCVKATSTSAVHGRHTIPPEASPSTSSSC